MLLLGAVACPARCGRWLLDSPMAGMVTAPALSVSPIVILVVVRFSR
jgi:hypothetical protein